MNQENKKTFFSHLFMYGALSLTLMNIQSISIKERIDSQAPFYSNILKLIHPNITYQKTYDAIWEEIFNNFEFLDEKEIGKMIKKLLNEKDQTNKRPLLIGFSSSGYQYEGGIHKECSWHEFAERNQLTLPGEGIGFWKNYKEIIREMKDEAHINAFRLSIEWARIEKEEGVFDKEALHKYKEIIKSLRDADIEPIIVLNHYTVPTWFEKKGSFAYEQNIHYFVRFSEQVYKELHNDVRYWSTCNAPEGIAFKGYYTLTGPPGYQKNMQLTMDTIKNILEAHCRIYESFKGNPAKGTIGLWQKLGGLEPQIGIQKNIIQLDVAADTLSQHLFAPVTAALNAKGDQYNNKPFYDFFTKGRFKVKTLVPSVDIDHYNEDAPYLVDWIGVNYYSNKRRFLLQDVQDTNKRLRTSNENYRFYPQGLYRAVSEVSDRLLKPNQKETNRTIPIWITENGIASIDDKQRKDFNKKIMIVLYQLLQEEFPIIGYNQWASHDNWEWGAKPGEKRYGSFFVDFDNIYAPHTLKVGAQGLADFIKELTK